MTELAGRVVLVTGAAGDIGGATADLLSARGARVVRADLVDTELQLDVTDAGHVGEVVAAIDGLNAVVNCAGIQGDFANVVDYDPADVGRVLNVNVAGTFNVVQAAARAMIAAQTPGSIVNLASMAGVSGAPNMVAYSASKAAVIALTKSAARDLAGHDIRVNAVSPAFIGPGAMWDRQVQLQADTPSQYFGDDTDTVAAQMINMVPLRRYGSLTEVAEVVAFLVSDRSSYLTATNTEISGGSA